MRRSSGVLMHISSLPGDYSIGSFGKEAFKFIDFLKECGFTRWQVLPFAVPDSYNSPYNSFSAFGGNPYFIDLPTLYEEGLITAEELERAKQKTPYVAEFERLREERVPLLMLASERASNKEEIKRFIEKRPRLLEFCRFMTRKQMNGYAHWQSWVDAPIDEKILFGWEFIQYNFYTQWQRVKKYANESGVSIIGDIPFYVSFDSCDVRSNKKLFMLDERDKPSNVAGVPPDYFCEDGQLWGNPLYNWEEMKKDGYGWWRERISYMAELFDGIRIDHFRAVESFWSVPGEAKTAKEGKWVKGPGMELVNAVREAAGDSFIIAEDLGDITDEVRELVEESGFPGMRVFQFGFMGEGDSLHKPHNYSSNSVAYSGTHDNNTLLGYLWELTPERRRDMLYYCGHFDEDWGRGWESVIRCIFASHSDTVLFPVQDLLGYGSDTRLNQPGRAEGNWQYRLTFPQLEEISREKYKKMNYIYNR